MDRKVRLGARLRGTFVVDDGSMTALDTGARGHRPTLPLSVVVVSYRGPDLVADCVAALGASTLLPAEIVVVDADPQGDRALDRNTVVGLSEIPTRIVPVLGNPGYAAASNRGAAATTAPWVLFMNADVNVETGCLETVFAEASLDDGIAIATCALRLPDGSLDHACHRGIPTPMDSLAYKLRLHRVFPDSHRFGRYTMAWLDASGVHDVEACSGAFLLIRRSALDAVDGWDERYWFYAEDLDLCVRVAVSGGRVRFVGSATATHLKGASSHLHADPSDLDAEQRATRERVERAVVEAHDLFYREHLEADTPRLLRPFISAQFSWQRLRQRWAR